MIWSLYIALVLQIGFSVMLFYSFRKGTEMAATYVIGALLFFIVLATIKVFNLRQNEMLLFRVNSSGMEFHDHLEKENFFVNWSMIEAVYVGDSYLNVKHPIIFSINRDKCQMKVFEAPFYLKFLETKCINLRRTYTGVSKKTLVEALQRIVFKDIPVVEFKKSITNPV